MGRKRNIFEQDSQVARCEVCSRAIPIEFYFDKGEVIVCSGCDTEYLLECRKPAILSILVDAYDDGFYDGIEYDF